MKNQILFVEKIFFSLLLLTLFKTNVFSQDIRSGDMIVSHISGGTYQTKIKIYQDLSNFINRPYILINWGDEAKLDTLLIDSATNDSLFGIRITTYNGMHSYPGNGVFVISYLDSFLISGINNISNSENEIFCLRDTISINFFLNSSPFFNNVQPILLSCCNWSYNSGAVDPDGDSLSYSLAPYTCVSNYSYPNEIFIDSITGTLTMHPTSIGKFAIGIRIKEWRKINNNYILIGTILRPMLLNVDSLWSVNTTELSPLFIIYPNPATDFIKINFNNSKMSSVEINIYDIFGKLVLNKKININIEEKNVLVDIKFIESGIYNIQLITSNFTITKKFIKL